MFKNDAWRAMHTERVNAKICIEDALRKYYDGHSLQSAAVMFVREYTVKDVASTVLAYNIQYKTDASLTTSGSGWISDDRFSVQNIEWAKKFAHFDAPENEQEELCRISWLVAADVRLLDRFVSMWRESLCTDNGQIRTAENLTTKNEEALR